MYVLGVVNNSRQTLHGVQCFVTGWDFQLAADYQVPPKQPLQPVGQAKGSERVDVPPSTNGQPSAYFEFVDHCAPTSSIDGANGNSPGLCAIFGFGQLPTVSKIDVSLEGDGFSIPARFSVATRQRSAEMLGGEYHDVRFLPLTVKRLR